MGAMPEPAAKSSTSLSRASSRGKPLPKGAETGTEPARRPAATMASATRPPRFTSRSARPSGAGALASAK
jgi:hypothetical protein